MRLFFAFILGSIFSIGLMLSGMSNPQKVLNFLDIFGNWDPSLAFVMAGAIFTAFLPFQFMLRKNQAKTIFGEPVQFPQNTHIDKSLIIGATLFGIGWGIAGICPAPALTLIGLGQYQALYFIIAMCIGIWIHRLWSTKVNV